MKRRFDAPGQGHLPGTMRPRPLSLTLAALAAAAIAPSAAGAASPPEGSRVVDVDVRVQSFAVQGRQIRAKGVAKVGLADPNGGVRTAQKPVTFQVKTGTSCRVLTLQLDNLHLELLGLIVDTSAVNLRITGQRRGGALGQLFCQLARGLRINRRALSLRASRTLNRRLGRKPMRAIGFSAQVRPVDHETSPGPQPSGSTARAAQASPTCQVLDLILGPLNLDLLGLRVDLYGASTRQPVRVLIIADPSKGILGQVFCRLARGEAQA